jgi:HD-GYP domain-containing protein (c-di-GMP phosphodiesterase class II)
MIKPIEMESNIRNTILYHHENFDGSGYPGKLAGEEIPIFARIIRVADSFRALISHRPYQKRYTVEEAFEVLNHRAGTFFDPKIVKIFIDAVRKNINEFEAEEVPVSKKIKEPVGTAKHHDNTTNSQGGI